MNFDEFARVVGYITIGFWVVMIILTIFTMALGKTAAVKKEGFKIAELFFVTKKEKLITKDGRVIPDAGDVMFYRT